jgi:hypothetical protein
LLASDSFREGSARTNKVAVDEARVLVSSEKVWSCLLACKDFDGGWI